MHNYSLRKITEKYRIIALEKPIKKTTPENRFGDQGVVMQQSSQQGALRQIENRGDHTATSLADTALPLGENLRIIPA